MSLAGRRGLSLAGLALGAVVLTYGVVLVADAWQIRQRERELLESFDNVAAVSDIDDHVDLLLAEWRSNHEAACRHLAALAGMSPAESPLATLAALALLERLLEGDDMCGHGAAETAASRLRDHGEAHRRNMENVLSRAGVDRAIHSSDGLDCAHSTMSSTGYCAALAQAHLDAAQEDAPHWHALALDMFMHLRNSGSSESVIVGLERVLSESGVRGALDIAYLAANVNISHVPWDTRLGFVRTLLARGGLESEFDHSYALIAAMAQDPCDDIADDQASDIIRAVEASKRQTSSSPIVSRLWNEQRLVTTWRPEQLHAFLSRTDGRGLDGTLARGVGCPQTEALLRLQRLSPERRTDGLRAPVRVLATAWIEGPDASAVRRTWPRSWDPGDHAVSLLTARRPDLWHDSLVDAAATNPEVVLARPNAVPSRELAEHVIEANVRELFQVLDARLNDADWMESFDLPGSNGLLFSRNVRAAGAGAWERAIEEWIAQAGGSSERRRRVGVAARFSLDTRPHAWAVVAGPAGHKWLIQSIRAGSFPSRPPTTQRPSTHYGSAVLQGLEALRIDLEAAPARRSVTSVEHAIEWIDWISRDNCNQALGLQPFADAVVDLAAACRNARDDNLRAMSVQLADRGEWLRNGARNGQLPPHGEAELTDLVAFLAGEPLESDADARRLQRMLVSVAHSTDAELRRELGGPGSGRFVRALWLCHGWRGAGDTRVIRTGWQQTCRLLDQLAEPGCRVPPFPMARRAVAEVAAGLGAPSASNLLESLEKDLAGRDTAWRYDPLLALAGREEKLDVLLTRCQTGESVLSEYTALCLAVLLHMRHEGATRALETHLEVAGDAVALAEVFPCHSWPGARRGTSDGRREPVSAFLRELSESGDELQYGLGAFRHTGE